MRYVDAGYAIGLGSIALYAVSLFWRRRRLERAVGRLSEQSAPLLGAEADGDGRR